MKKLLFPLCLVLISAIALMPGCTLYGPQLPIVNSFEANPPSISAGVSSTITWNISGAASVSIDQGIGNVALAGSRVVAPSTTTTYTLTATNAAGSSITATCQVMVAGTPGTPPVAGQPVVVSFTANPSGVTAGSSSTLSWNVSNATSITIDQGIGTVAGSGSTVVLPAATTTYTLTASNAVGSTMATTQVIVSSGGSTPPPAPFAVLGVTAMAEPTTFTGACPKNFMFSALITVNGPGTVTYRWERSDGGSSPLQTAVFAAAGTQTVNTGWTRDVSGAYWVRVHTLAPNEVLSNQAGFTVNCEIPGEVTGVTASVTPQSYGGPCPKNFSCSATITVNGPCTVTYVWERLPDLGSSPVQTVTFTSAGSKTVTTGWPLNKTQMYGLIVRTLTPNVMVSSQFLFALECQ